MILPSDGDPPPRRRDNDDDVPPQDAENEDWWEDDDDDEDEDEAADGGDADDLPESYEGEQNYSPEDKFVLKSMAPPGWRDDLLRELVDSVADLRDIEDPDDEYDPPEPPDLYTFFGELAALRNEMRRGGRRAFDTAEKTAAAFDSMQSLLRGMGPAAQKSKSAAPEPWSQELCLALIALHDLMSQTHPGPAAEASLEPLLKAAGLERLPAQGGGFDPATMTVAAVEPAPDSAAPGTVLREIEAGFLRAGKLLRPAKVVVSG